MRTASHGWWEDGCRFPVVSLHWHWQVLLPPLVIPAKAGIHFAVAVASANEQGSIKVKLDPGLISFAAEKPPG